MALTASKRRIDAVILVRLMGSSQLVVSGEAHVSRLQLQHYLFDLFPARTGECLCRATDRESAFF